MANVGEECLKLSTNSTFGHNVLLNSGLSDATARAVLGGSPSAGNICDDESCTRRGERRYYLTTALFDGAEADDPGNCAQGFHFASLYEILDISSLRYDKSLGFNKLDSGQGPPTQTLGWIRTGANAETSVASGVANCSAWDSNVLENSGTTVLLSGLGNSPGLRSNPWSAASFTCLSNIKIWCVEN